MLKPDAWSSGHCFLVSTRAWSPHKLKLHSIEVKVPKPEIQYPGISADSDGTGTQSLMQLEQKQLEAFTDPSASPDTTRSPPPLPNSGYCSFWRRLMVPALAQGSTNAEIRLSALLLRLALSPSGSPRKCCLRLRKSDDKAAARCGGYSGCPDRGCSRLWSLFCVC